MEHRLDGVINELEWVTGEAVRRRCHQPDLKESRLAGLRALRAIRDAERSALPLADIIQERKHEIGTSIAKADSDPDVCFAAPGLRRLYDELQALEDRVRAVEASRVEQGPKLVQSDLKDAVFIEVSACVRYWEDAAVDGVGDTDGSLIPLREGHLWKPVIRLSDGAVRDWPEGVKASVHYKVCDDGEYWLLNADEQRIAKWAGHYVPDDFLCHGDDGYGDYIIFDVGGYGDYIIFDVGGDGRIVGWKTPAIDLSEWAIGVGQ